MTIQATVTNTGDGVLGRGGYRFDPGESTDIKISATQFAEVFNHPDLEVTVTGADNPAEIRDAEDAGIKVEIAATDAAVRLAEERGVNLFGLTGSGSGGKIVVDDVRRASGDERRTIRDYIPPEGDYYATTLDSPNAQRRAEDETRKEFEERQVLGASSQESPPTGEAAIGEPSQPSQASEAIGTEGQWREDAPRKDRNEAGVEESPSAAASRESGNKSQPAPKDQSQPGQSTPKKTSQ